MDSKELYQRLPFRGQINEAKLAATTQALKAGNYVFVATGARPNSKRHRAGVLSFLGFPTTMRWRSRRWAILSPERFKAVPDQYLTFLEHIDFVK